MSSFEMTVSRRQKMTRRSRRPPALAALWGPVLGLAVPLALAAGMGVCGPLGWSDGRLVPPPSVIGATLWEPARSGELWVIPRRRFFAWSSVSRSALPPARCSVRSRAIPRSRATGRSDAAGPARDSVHRLGAAVHSVARHFRSLESHPDRGRRILSDLSRCDGRHPLGRSQDRGGRPRLPSFRSRAGARILLPAVLPAYVVSLRRARPRLDVRGRRRIHGRVRGARLSPDRRPAARQAGADRRRYHRLRRDRQDHRLAADHWHRAVPALGRPVPAARGV